MYRASNQILTSFNWEHSIIKHGIAIHTRLTTQHQFTNWTNAFPKATWTSKCICGRRSMCHATRLSLWFQRTDVDGNWPKTQRKPAFHQYLKLRIQHQKAFKRKRPVFSVGQKFARNCRTQAISIWRANSSHCVKLAIQQNVSELMLTVYRMQMATTAYGLPTKIQKQLQIKPSMLAKMVWAASEFSIYPMTISVALALAISIRFWEQPNSVYPPNNEMYNKYFVRRSLHATVEIETNN